MVQEEWRPSTEADAAIRQWMTAEGLAVNSTRYYLDDEVYAWRHEEPDASPTLWIARTVLEDYDPPALVAALDRLHVAVRMREQPKARFLLADEDGVVTISPWGHGPYRGA
jgi:hypothetical protein